MDLERIKTGWTVEGLSAGQLAGIFGQSRNVIIGICHRRGWTQPGGPGAGQRARSRPRPDLKSRAPAPKPASPPAPKVTPLVLDPDKFVAFDQLGPHHCRYPIDGGGKDGMYCGQVPDGSPYCEGHARIVYSPTQPRKIKRPR